jgi:hypothetical protein
VRERLRDPPKRPRERLTLASAIYQRPTKSSDTRAKDFEGESVELDAIPPDRLRDLVRNAILEHLPMTEFRRLMDIEARERRQIAAMVRRMR